MPNEFFSLKENRLAFKILNIMNFRVLFIYLQLCLFLQNGYSQESSLVVPVIRLCPEEAITLRTSELFDGYRIFSLNGSWRSIYCFIGDKNGRALYCGV